MGGAEAGAAGFEDKVCQVEAAAGVSTGWEGPVVAEEVVIIFNRGGWDPTRKEDEGEEEEKEEEEEASCEN